MRSTRAGKQVGCLILDPGVQDEGFNAVLSLRRAVHIAHGCCQKAADVMMLSASCGCAAVRCWQAAVLCRVKVLCWFWLIC